MDLFKILVGFHVIHPGSLPFFMAQKGGGAPPFGGRPEAAPHKKGYFITVNYCELLRITMKTAKELLKNCYKTAVKLM